MDNFCASSFLPAQNAPKLYYPNNSTYAKRICGRGMGSFENTEALFKKERRTKMPLELANAIYKTSSIVALMALALSATAGIFIYVTSEIRGKHADQSIENARTLGAQANEAAALANVKAELLTKDNLQLSLTLEKERRERIELEKKLGPRSLSTEQKLAMRNALQNISSTASVLIIRSDSSSEVSNYASEIAQIFRESGIQVAEQQTKIIKVGSPNHGTSLILLGGPAKETIKNAITLANIATETREIKKPSDEDQKRMIYKWELSAVLEIKSKPPHL